MWDRFSRRTLAPSEAGNRHLAALTLVVLVASAAFAVYAVLT